MDWTDNVLFRGDVDQAAYEAAEKLVGILVRWKHAKPQPKKKCRSGPKGPASVIYGCVDCNNKGTVAEGSGCRRFTAEG